MPPKARITRDMIVDAGLTIVRTEGVDSLNVRKIAAALSCSTQPVMYHFKTVSELRAAVYEAADALHTAYIMTPDESAGNPFLSIGLRYIRFAAEEGALFRFLFESDSFASGSLQALMDADALQPMLTPLCQAADLTPEQAREVFSILFLCVHGAAGMIANNSIEYDIAYLTRLLSEAFTGAVIAVKEEHHEAV